MLFSILKLSNGTTTINLMAHKSGFHVKEWRPNIAKYKGDGVWNDNVMAHGRKLKMRRFTNVTESIPLMALDYDKDTLIEALQDLRRLLESAADYWEHEYITTPVYIEARGLCETNSRYAVVYAGSIPEDPDVADPTFVVNLVADGITLSLEHALWQSTIPGNGDCVQVSSVRTIHMLAVSGSTDANELISEDDCYVKNENTVLTIALANTENIWQYNVVTPYLLFLNGFRFRNVDIPAGAIVLSAYVTFTSSDDLSGEVDVNIVGDSDTTPNQYSTWMDYLARVPTGNTVTWQIVADWVTGNAYDCPDISAIIQEIVGTLGWVRGNNLALQFNTIAAAANRRTAWSVDGTTPPVLHVTYTVDADVDFGRAATCLDEVFVANKQHTAQLTHVFHYDDDTASWSTNLVNATKPVALLPAIPATDDIIYFGIDTSLADTGPFSNIVFDIGIAQAALNGTWEYLDVAAWYAFDVVHPSVNLVDNTLDFGVVGVKSVVFSQFEPDNTHAMVIGVVHGVTGYWVRWKCTTGAAAPPTQQNRDIYTTVTPHVDIAATEIGGDIPAISQLSITQHGEGFDYIYNYHRLLIASRSVLRGSDFSPYINLGDTQNNAAITVVPVGGTTSTIILYSSSPTGYAMQYKPVGAEVLANNFDILITQALSSQYYGKFRVYLLFQPTTTPRGTFTSQLTASYGSPGSVLVSRWTQVYQSGVITMSLASGYEMVYVLDYGILSWPDFLKNATSANMKLSVALGQTLAGTFNMYSLVLWPVDESCVDILSPGRGMFPAYNYDDMLADGLSAKGGIDAYTCDIASGLKATQWQVIGRSIDLLPGKAQRIYVMNMYNLLAAPNVWMQEPFSLLSVQLYKAQRYLSMRGSR